MLAGVVVLAAFGSAADLAAQRAEGNAVLGGVVAAEEAGSPLPGVEVELVSSGRRTRTDEQGRFRFTRVSVGEHMLRFTLIGRSVLERTVRVDESGRRDVEVWLGAAPVALDPLLVLLDRTRMTEGAGADAVPGALHVVTAQSIEDRPVLFDDVHALLREIPGVNVQQEEGYGLRPNIGLRGTGTERSSKITLMEDGVLIAPAPYAAPSAYYFPLAGRMEAIEVRKGSSQIRYGPSTIGGALNMVSSGIPGSFSLFADAAGGTDATRKLHVRAGDTMGRIGWSLESYRMQTDGFKRLDGGGPTGFDVEDYVGKIRVSTDLDASVYQELELKLGYYDQRSDETYLGLTQSDFAVTPFRRYAGSQKDVMKADHRQVQLRHFLRLSSGLDLVTTAYRNEFARNWYKLGGVNGASISTALEDPAGYADEVDVLEGAESGDDALVVRANNREYLSRGIQSALGLEFDGAGAHEVEIGVRYHEDEVDRFQHEDAYAMRGGEMVLTTQGEPGSQSNRVSAASAWSLYAQDRIALGRLTLVPGIRFETIDFIRRDYSPADAERATPTAVRENAVSAWIPGLGASWAARPGVRLFAGVHRGFGPPGPGADGETKAESSVNYELGARVSRGSVATQVAAFYSDYDNILGAATLSSGGEGTGDLYNGGAVSVAGLEVSASHDPLAGRSAGWRLPLQLSYTYTRATFESGFESDFDAWGTVQAGDELPYLPAHQLFARAGVERGPWSATLSGTGVSAMRTLAGQGAIPDAESAAGYVVFGFGVRYDLASGTEIYAGVENLTDEIYVAARRPAGARPGLPRTLQLGVRLSR